MKEKISGCLILVMIVGVIVDHVSSTTDRILNIE